jgi:hypothetical protein
VGYQNPDRKDPIMKSSLTAVAAGVALLVPSVAPAPAPAHNRLKCSELRAMVIGAWKAAPGRATGCRRLHGTRYYVQGRYWKASLNVVHFTCRPDPRACHVATDVVYNLR